MSSNLKSVLVIGGGIAGIQASLDLANMGIQVYIVEKQPCIGGRMAQLDKTFPTNDCSICILSPKLSECYRHPNITLYSYSEVLKIEGSIGNFSIEILKKARFVREDKCINCGLCAEKCPTKVEDLFDRNLRKRKAIYMYYMQGIPAVMAIDKDKCLYISKGVCQLCMKACERGAIDFSMKDEIIKLNNVGAVIVSVGYNLIEDINKEILSRYGYGKYKNVVSALDFERMESASGPQGGLIRRFSDGKHPKKIAFLQCIGSRDQNIKQYCSSICCVYTTKEAMIAYEHDNELESYIFFIDMRAGGKGFYSFLERGAKEYNIKYIKSKVAEIKIDENENPIIIYEDIETGKIKSLLVDLVVLATSIVPPKGIKELAEILKIELNEYNFIKTKPYYPIETTRDGIYICGCAHEPIDIPSSVAEASAAAAKAAEVIKKFS